MYSASIHLTGSAAPAADADADDDGVPRWLLVGASFLVGLGLATVAALAYRRRVDSVR